MKLIKLSDYVTRIREVTHLDTYKRIYKYTEFLKQKLTLGMFIPCDLDGNVLEEFNASKHGFKDGTYYKELQEAKERVLFKGFEIFHENEVSMLITINGNKTPLLNYLKEDKVFKHNQYAIKTIEDLTEYNLELTKDF